MSAEWMVVFVVAIAIAALVVVIGSALLLGRLVLARRIAGEVDDLFASAKGEPRLVVDQDIRGLPEPVRRWLRASNVIGTAFPVTVRLRQHGEFRMGKGKRWMPFHAEEYYSTARDAGPGLDQGALLRFLNETMWFPAAGGSRT